jgi:hypothetical protein
MNFRSIVLIRHKVANYRKWKAVFEAHGPVRVAQGCQAVHVFRRADNPKELVVMLAWGDLGEARQFLASDDLRDMLAEIPVSDRTTDVYLLEELDQICRPAPADQPRSAADEPSGAIGDRVGMSSPRAFDEWSGPRPWDGAFTDSDVAR